MQMRFVNTYDVNISANSDTSGIWTMGLSTCTFLCIKTKKTIIGWHFGADNMTGLNMMRINCLLNSIHDKDVLRVYLVPGIDRDEELAIKKTSRTVKYRPDTVLTRSRDWLLNYIKIFNWSYKLEVLGHVHHRKELVVFNRQGYTYGRNDDFHDKLCIQDAETMI
jgi:hypothetical protein